MEYDGESSVNVALVETEDYEAEHSERIFLKPSCIDSIFLWLLEDDVKSAVNAAIGESVDVEAFIWAYIEDYEVAASG